MNQKELAKQIGRRFRSFRVTQGLQQKTIASILGVSHSNISRLERGAVYRFSASFLGGCRAEFGLSIDWLLTGRGLMIQPEVDFKMSLPKLRPKGRKKRPGDIDVLSDQRGTQQKLDELVITLARVTHLIQELFTHVRDRDVQAKK